LSGDGKKSWYLVDGFCRRINNKHTQSTHMKRNIILAIVKQIISNRGVDYIGEMFEVAKAQYIESIGSVGYYGVHDTMQKTITSAFNFLMDSECEDNVLFYAIMEEIEADEEAKSMLMWSALKKVGLDDAWESFCVEEDRKQMEKEEYAQEIKERA